MVHITGEETPVTTAQTNSLKFNTMPWFSNPQATSRGITTRGTGPVTALDLHTVNEDDDEQKKQASSISWKLNRDDLSEGTFVHKLSSMKSSTPSSSDNSTTDRSRSSV